MRHRIDLALSRIDSDQRATICESANLFLQSGADTAICIASWQFALARSLQERLPRKALGLLYLAHDVMTRAPLEGIPCEPWRRVFSGILSSSLSDVARLCRDVHDSKSYLDRTLQLPVLWRERNVFPAHLCEHLLRVCSQKLAPAPPEAYSHPPVAHFRLEPANSTVATPWAADTAQLHVAQGQPMRRNQTAWRWVSLPRKGVSRPQLSPLNPGHMCFLAWIQRICVYPPHDPTPPRLRWYTNACVRMGGELTRGASRRRRDALLRRGTMSQSTMIVVTCLRSERQRRGGGEPPF